MGQAVVLPYNHKELSRIPGLQNSRCDGPPLDSQCSAGRERGRSIRGNCLPASLIKLVLSGFSERLSQNISGGVGGGTTPSQSMPFPCMHMHTHVHTHKPENRLEIVRHGETGDGLNSKVQHESALRVKETLE